MIVRVNAVVENGHGDRKCGHSLNICIRICKSSTCWFSDASSFFVAIVQDVVDVSREELTTKTATKVTLTVARRQILLRSWMMNEKHVTSNAPILHAIHVPVYHDDCTLPCNNCAKLDDDSFTSTRIEARSRRRG